MGIDARFAKWATGFSGCDGGDIGSPKSRSIWFCGIEWGWGHPNDVKKLQGEGRAGHSASSQAVPHMDGRGIIGY